MSGLRGNFAEKVDIGKVRRTNEDRSLAVVNAGGDVLLAVCDGMGGDNKGDLAASLTIETIDELFVKVKKFKKPWNAKSFIKRCFRVANRVVYNESHTHEMYKDMGTCVSIAIITEGFMVTGQMGDTRVYKLAAGTLTQLTTDHSLAMREYRMGKISKDEVKTAKNRHILTNALGIHKIPASDIEEYEYRGETILVCSDGLYNNVSTAELESILKGTDSTSSKINQLINQANANGGSDNIAAVLWESK
ncbi:MAG: protein phosphatase 2C domain-containing protein [Bacilli bacterium]|nr:protein phosphatase 2C domain-containing protein [Bacilli bacterium]